MTAEQQLRFEVLKLLVSTNHCSLAGVLEYADKMVAWITTGVKVDNTFSCTDPSKFFENPLRVKVNAATGIPVEFSR